MHVFEPGHLSPKFTQYFGLRLSEYCSYLFIEIFERESDWPHGLGNMGAALGSDVYLGPFRCVCKMEGKSLEGVAPGEGEAGEVPQITCLHIYEILWAGAACRLLSNYK